MDTRNTLLFAQLLFSQSIDTPEQLGKLSDSERDALVYRVLHHKSVQLNGEPMEGLTAETIGEVYQRMLEEWSVATTTALADAAYYKRIEELEGELDGCQKEFTEVLNEA
ncbi:hypothetical protein DICA0_F13872 [Diutina catenulata]